MEKVYDYCDRCGCPIYRTDTTQNDMEFCQECAMKLYKKIFESDENDQ